VRLDHVDRPFEALLYEEGETGRMLDHAIGGNGFVRQLEANAPRVADDPHPGIGVEPARRRVGSGEDVDRPVREPQHGPESRRASDIPLPAQDVTGNVVSVVSVRYPVSMEARLVPQQVHEEEPARAAPDDLELVRGFLSLHDHEQGNPDGMPPSLESLRWWLGARNLLPPEEHVRDQDLAWALRVRDALTAKVRESMGEPRDEDATALLNRAAEETGVRVCFGCAEGDAIHVEAAGVRGAIGRILGTAFLAELDGRWQRLRICHDEGCSTVFFDRSKNKSGKWCSMDTCGNRAKVRAFRARQAAE